MGYVDEKGLKTALGFVKNYVDGKPVNVPTPDWNATEGEAGFIKNRTHYGYFIEETETIDLTNVKANDKIKLGPSGYFPSGVRVNNDRIYEIKRDNRELELEFSGPAIRCRIVEHEATYLLILSDSIGVPNYVEFGDYTLEKLDEKYIPDTIARTEQLTELSQEVSGLSEEMANKQDVYVAEYGVTTREQIKAAWEANKHIVCVYGNKLYNLTNYGDVSDIYFACVYYSVELLMLSVAGNWSRKTLTYERQDYKVKTISASSTDAHYPSAKAVYDFVNNAIGNVIINGDY